MSDINSRRAFPLDSRSAWVEQQHVGNLNDQRYIMLKENRVLGPGEYNPKDAVIRNISSPALGGSRGIVDHFHPFKSGLSINTPLRGGVLRSQQLNAPYNIVDYIPLPGHDTDERCEHVSIFHEHDRRQPLDPRRRYCKTPGARLTHNPMLQTQGVDGIRRPTNVIFGPDDIPFGDRTSVKLALPAYDIQYDSQFIKPRTKMGKISETR